MSLGTCRGGLNVYTKLLLSEDTEVEFDELANMVILFSDMLLLYLRKIIFMFCKEMAPSKLARIKPVSKRNRLLGSVRNVFRMPIGLDSRVYFNPPILLPGSIKNHCAGGSVQNLGELVL